jgi:hypothetical protein
LRALAKFAHEQTFIRLEPLFDATHNDSIATAGLATVALQSDRPELALRAFSCPATGLEGNVTQAD